MMMFRMSGDVGLGLFRGDQYNTPLCTRVVLRVVFRRRCRVQKVD